MDKNRYEVEFLIILKDTITLDACNYDDAALKCIKQVKKMYKGCTNISIGQTKILP